MLRMIIADDESIVRESLKNIIPWNEFGIEVIADAADGQEALEMCLSLQPDILFTDIRMPIMDGLEVALKLKEKQSDIKIIIISGIQDFNYAKTALDINAEGYILKPVKIPELKEVILKVVNRIILEKDREKELQLLKKQLAESIPAIRDKFIKNLIAGSYTDEREIQEKLAYFNIPIKIGENLLIAVFQIDDFHKNNTEEFKQLLSFSTISIIDKIVNNYMAGISICSKENEFIIIFNQNAQANKKYTEICEEVISCVNKFLNISISGGIGRVVNGILTLSLSYSDAITALHHRFYTGKNSLIDINDINTGNKNIVYPDLINIENQIINYVKSGDSENVKYMISETFNLFRHVGNLPVKYVQSVCAELVFITSRSVFELGENIDNIVGSRFEILNSIYKKEDIFNLHDYISSIFTQISDYFHYKYSQKNFKVIKKIKEIIDKKYMEDISVAKLAEKVYLTPNYISLIFKQETGETITEYITRVRMEAAKGLLKSTDMKIYEIAEKVGYENPHYFSTTFKKYTGIHPVKYRTNLNS